MCGNCVLQETAFICPMECPKGLRNGPCGGATEVCYVDATRPCIWYRIYQRAIRMGREERLMEVLPPLDWGRVGRETWGGVVREVRRVGLGAATRALFTRDSERRRAVADAVFRPIRQPEWWGGDDKYHAPGYQDPMSQLERRLRAGEFVVAAEVTPPLGAHPVRLASDLALLAPHVTAVNFTDGSSARARMSSLACSLVALQTGIEPVLQVAARDNTRTGLQGHAVGAAALGIRNLLAVSGDSPVVGPPPQARMDWLDLDAVQMLWMLRRLRDDAAYLDGRVLSPPPRYFLGAAASPLASTPRIQAMREHKKVNAGAQFLQTNLVFEVGALDPWLEELGGRGILDRVFVLVGVPLLRTLKVALYLHEKVPGVTVPTRVLDRLERAGADAAEEGFQMALETVTALRSRTGVSGVHLITMGWEGAVPRLVTEAGIGGGA